MDRPSILLNFSLLKENRDFRALFCARFISVLALGMLTVAVPVQIQQMTGSTLQVGLAVVLAGGGMFIGLLLGGVMADRYNRRRLILFARATCGAGFAGLFLNTLAPEPSLILLWLLAVWDGFFGAVGMTALMAATSALVGRENLASAGGISMLTVRFGAVVSPAIGGMVIAWGDVGWNYALAAVGTWVTLIPLIRLPSMPPPQQPKEHPGRALLAGVVFLKQNRVIGAIVLMGTLVSLTSAVRVLFPALAIRWQIDALHLGLMYSAIPLGAALGAFTSGRVAQTPRPGRLMIFTAVAGFLVLSLFSLMPYFVLSLCCLAIYGYLSAINSLLQFTLVQSLTPNALLGRVNGLWTAQAVTGDAFGALLLGTMGTQLLPQTSGLLFGLGAALAGVALAALSASLRRLENLNPPQPASSAGN
ncbi:MULTISPECIES: enterobactin transporter EntS [unclassified Brenneria]|uniref:enterobactin transporter EntS n=1 Tax=unclassified Brenneria TaxID=2634434 RepID=UPI0018F08C83|nr:enterobactin transporter EntS [Brenneria sp. L3-3C-1]MBJ7222346.1 enterobactin transporter EntS [Brenneria sp. L3-3C-1]MEE3643589.1 enterobactin transporter EntS [Brenneria sp. L3_3C_1]